MTYLELVDSWPIMTSHFGDVPGFSCRLYTNAPKLPFLSNIHFFFLLWSVTHVECTFFPKGIFLRHVDIAFQTHMSIYHVTRLPATVNSKRNMALYTPGENKSREMTVFWCDTWQSDWERSRLSKFSQNKIPLN